MRPTLRRGMLISRMQSSIPASGAASCSLSVPGVVAAAVAARANLQRSVDYVLLHEGYDVDGDTPAASLNPPTVLTAVAAWERFVGDLKGVSLGDEWTASGRYQSRLSDCYLVRPPHPSEPHTPDQTVTGEAARLLLQITGSSDVLDHLCLKVISSWSGARPRFGVANGLGLRPASYRRTTVSGVSDPLTVGEAVYQSVQLRNAVAHSYLPAMSTPRPRQPKKRTKGQSAQSLPAQHWLDDPDEFFWRSDKKDGLSVQAGCARGVLALFIQLIDQVLIGIAASALNELDKQAIMRARPPAEWFNSTVPAGSRRGIDYDAQLWRGNRLIRVHQ
jgi:hypothetical protein